MTLGFFFTVSQTIPKSYNRPDLQRDYDNSLASSHNMIPLDSVTTDLIYKGIMTLKVGTRNVKFNIPVTTDLIYKGIMTLTQQRIPSSFG